MGGGGGGDGSSRPIPLSGKEAFFSQSSSNTNMSLQRDGRRAQAVVAFVETRIKRR